MCPRFLLTKMKNGFQKKKTERSVKLNADEHRLSDYKDPNAIQLYVYFSEKVLPIDTNR
jgi:ribosomal protein S18